MTTTARLLRRARSVSPALLPALAVVAVLLLVGLPLLTRALLDADGAWLIGLLAGAVLLGQLVVLAGLTLLGLSVGQLARRSTALAADMARTRTDVVGARDEVRRSAVTSRSLADQVAAIGEAQARLAEEQQKGHQKLLRAVDNEGRATFRQVQALHQLFDLVRPERALPPLGGWAVSPDLALHVVQHLLDHRPRVVVECGSGSSTLLMALAVRRHGLPTRIVSLDHDAAYADTTRRLLAENGVGDVAEVRTALPAPPPVEGHSTPWYDVAALDGLPEVDLLIVDGPPSLTGPDARYPAVPLLRERLAPGATVLLDDYARPEERAVARRWLEELPGATLRKVELQKGLAVITLPAVPPPEAQAQEPSEVAADDRLRRFEAEAGR